MHCELCQRRIKLNLEALRPVVSRCKLLHDSQLLLRAHTAALQRSPSCQCIELLLRLRRCCPRAIKFPQQSCVAGCQALDCALALEVLEPEELNITGLLRSVVGAAQLGCSRCMGRPTSHRALPHTFRLVQAVNSGLLRLLLMLHLLLLLP